MYPSIESLVAWAEDDDPADRRPMILCEYSHAMGNSNGSLSDYWDAFESHPGLQGGFIWEWCDHALVQTLADGTTRLAYGGDFGDKPNDLNFCCDGIVSADRVPHSGLWEFKVLAQPVSVSWVKLGWLAIKNKRDFTSLSDLAGHWVLEIDGKEVARGILPPLTAEPGKVQVVEPALPNLTRGQDQAAFLMLRFSQVDSTPYAPSGHEVAWVQLAVDLPVEPERPVAAKLQQQAVRVSEDPVRIDLTGENFALGFDRATGRLENLTRSGKVVLLAGPRLQIWRGATDNDGIKGWSGQDDKPLGRWLKAGVNAPSFQTPTVSVERSGEYVAVHVVQVVDCAGGSLTHSHSYTVAPSGLIVVENQFEVSIEDLPRLGITMSVPDDFEALEWFGRGPGETYSDRKAAGWIGQFASTVTDQYVDHVLPQEHGNKTNLAWMRLASPSAEIRFKLAAPAEGSATRYTPDVLYAARHRSDLTPTSHVIVNLDVGQRGLGTASCGPDTLERYRLKSGLHRLGFEIG